MYFFKINMMKLLKNWISDKRDKVKVPVNVKIHSMIDKVNGHMTVS